jgi:hypothetical protein
MSNSSDQESDEDRVERRKRRKDRRSSTERRGPERVVTVEVARRKANRREKDPISKQ